MTSWDDVAAAAPDLAKAVQARFEANLHAVLATLRADGSPRVSGTETLYAGGHLRLGSMGGSRKSADLVRDGRFALHSLPDIEMQAGDAKVSGRAVQIVDPDEWAAFRAVHPRGGDAPGPYELFKADITEVVLIRVVGDHMQIDTWHPGEAPRSIERR
jgi:hypothetical protein